MDRDLVTRAQKGDEAAFEALAVSSHARLFRLARGILRDTDLADDAVQRTLVQMWRKLPQLRDPDRFEGWTYRLLVNSCHDEAKGSRGIVRELHVDVAHDSLHRDEIDAVEDLDEIEQGFRHLSVDHRTVIVLRYLLDLSIEQVAEVLGVPSGTVSSRLHRAMSELRAAIEADARVELPSQGAVGAPR